MVEANKTPAAEEPVDDIDNMTDDQFEALCAKLPKMTPEEQEADMEEWVNHPLNCQEVTPEMLERPEYQALMAMAHEGTPEEVQENFKNHAMEHLGRLLLKKSKNEEKDFQESLYCFDQALEQKTGNKNEEFELLVGRAKLNILRGQFGKTKDDCLQAIKRKSNDEQCWVLLVRSRFFVEKWDEASKYIRDASLEVPNSQKLANLRAQCDEHMKKEIARVKEIEIIKEGNDTRMMAVYRMIREKGIKLGKRVHHLPEVHDQHIKLDNRKKLHFPVLILYEEFMTTDFIQDWPEDDTLAEQLRPLFADQAPWDEEGVYRMDTIEVYFEADMTKLLDKKEAPENKSTKKYIKCDLNSKLLPILQHPNYIVPQFPVFKIISRENDDFKEAFLNEI